MKLTFQTSNDAVHEVIVEVKVFIPCQLKFFTIDGQRADEGDFGYSYSTMRDERCCHKEFKRKPYRLRYISEKYKLTESDYNDICGFLENVLSVDCGFCNEDNFKGVIPITIIE
jgi:hypothetical protein